MKQVLRFLSGRNLKLIFIAVPTLLSAIYLIVFAANRYESASVVSVRKSGDSSVSLDGIAAILAPAGASGSREDALMLKTYLQSQDMLVQLDKKLHLRAAFSSPRADWFYRLSPNASNEEFLDYFRNRIEVTLDDLSGLLTVRTQAFTADLALAMNAQMVALGEAFINETSHRMARDQLSFGEGELARAAERVQQTKKAALTFQGKNQMLDPVAQAIANTAVTGQLQATLARQEAELRSTLAFFTEDSYQVKALRAQIEGTKGQIEAESKRSTTLSPKGSQLNALAIEYQGLLAGMQYAEDGYKLALTSMETARLESTRKLKSLILVDSPAKADAPHYPRRFYSIVLVLICSSLVYAVARLVVATIEDHQD